LFPYELLLDGGEEVMCNNDAFCVKAFPFLKSAENIKCKEVHNPNFGMTSFDNTLVSMVNIFIIITLEGWSSIMYNIRVVMGSYYYDLFFVIVVLLGNFFVLNLMIAV